MQRRGCRRANEWSRANFLVSTCSPTSSPRPLAFLPSFLPRFTRDPLSTRERRSKRRRERERERVERAGIVKQEARAPDDSSAARRRFDEHYNIIRIGLALNEVGGARARSDKGN